MIIPFFKELATSERILIAGAGGGFDIVNGIPLFLYLKSLGKEVVLANLSFSALSFSDSEEIAPYTYLINEKSREFSYFPEKFMHEWLLSKNMPTAVYGFSNKAGVKQIRAGYEAIIRQHAIDTVILVDGGTDSIIFGDEPGVGTIVEDACSMVAAANLPVAKSFLVALGFGIDHFHDVNHHACLQNIATLIKDKTYRGAVSVTEDMPEGRGYIELVEFLNNRNIYKKSIVVNSVSSAMQGEFGDHHATERTGDQELFINALMCIYWTFDLAGLVRRMGFAPLIEDAETMQQVAEKFHVFRDTVEVRPRKSIPL